ncbi:MAG: twin-arginine translocation signal domain-containing protein, partial [Chitinophagaceae bacterium]
MEIKNQKITATSEIEEVKQTGFSRRKFLHFSGLMGASVVVVGSMAGLPGCKKDDKDGSGVN